MGIKTGIKEWSYFRLGRKIAVVLFLVWAANRYLDAQGLTVLTYITEGASPESFWRYLFSWQAMMDSPWLAGVSPLLVGSLSFAFLRRVQSSSVSNTLFEETALMSIPKDKTRYSDRMAYVLAELSELAYYEVERQSDAFAQFLNEVKDFKPEKAEDLEKFIHVYQNQTRTGSMQAEINVFNEQDLASELGKHGFRYEAPYLNCGSSQGFICVREGDYPYIVVAFRGTEKKIEDWLTDIHATPIEIGKGKVHSGFYDDFMGVKAQIEVTLARIQEKYQTKVPVYFTGHSLGGAVALIATKEIMPDGLGACYSFGAPQVGNYEYFEFVKTPVYRVVNASDIVPRVPPGAYITMLLRLMKVLRWIAKGINPAFRDLLLKIEAPLNKLKDYRHFGDQRYLTDVASGKFSSVKLLRAPNYYDVSQWFWRHVLISAGLPMKSHSLNLYRKKLAVVAKTRMKPKA